MKITDVKVQVIRREVSGGTLSHGGISFIKEHTEVPIFRIFTDEGIEGTSCGRSGLLLAQYLASLKPLLIGEDPLYIERIWQKLWQMDRVTHPPSPALGVVDVALWDIVGKAANLPIYQLLGAYRDKVKAYASSAQYPNVEAYVKQALECKARGFTAYKLHVSGIPSEDLAVCRAVREAVGDDMILMHDPVGLYDREQAMMVGRELEKLNFYWYEEPVSDFDIDGLIQLRNALDIPIVALETLPGNIYIRAQYIARGAVDIVRADVCNHGGITPLKKIASLAEAFGMKCEIHVCPNPWTDTANLHVICAIKNCEFYEWFVPDELLQFGVKENLKLDSEGYVHVPKGPGLGIEPDWEYIDSHTIQTL